MNDSLVTRFRNVLAGLFSSENSKYTQIHFFREKYYINEPIRLRSGKLAIMDTNWKIYTEEEFEKYIEHYEEQLLARIEV